MIIAMSIPIIGNPLGYFNDPLEATLPMMAELGYDQIEICHCQITDFRTPALRQQFAEFIESLGMKLVGSNVPDSPYFQMLNSSDDVKVALAGLKRDIDIAQDLGVEYVITYEGRVPPGATQELIMGRLLDDTVSLLSEATGYAVERNIDLFIEIHPFTLGTNLDFSTQLIERIGSDHFGVAYDPCHLSIGIPDGYLEAIHRFGPAIKHVHFSDGDQQSSESHFPPGRGCLNLDGMVQGLKEINFSGRWMLDLYLYPLPCWGSREGLDYMRKMLAEW